MRLKICYIPKNELNRFFKLVDGYAGISDSDRSWIVDEHSQPVRIILFCFLIAQGELFVQDQKLRSFHDGHGELIQFIEGYFQNKCIVNFTDLFFLDAINQAFCGGRWHNVHPSWLVERPELFIDRVLNSPNLDQPIMVVVENVELGFEEIFIWRLSNYRITVIDFFVENITWRKKPISFIEMKSIFHLNGKNYSINLISFDTFYSHIIDIVEPKVGSLLN